MQMNWYEQFFRGLALEFWRNAVSAEQTAADVDFIEGELGLTIASRVLDIPCGNGRHSIELAKRGHIMTGIDLCDEFLTEARQAFAQNGVQIDFVSGNMGDIVLAHQFDGAFCFGNSFGYMSHEDNVKFLAAVGGCLRPGARFVIETGLVAESLLPSLAASRWHRANDVFALSAHRYDPAESQLNTEYTFLRGGTIETGTATYSVYTIGELNRLLSNCGFVVENLYATPGRQPYSLGCPRLLLTARRT